MNNQPLPDDASDEMRADATTSSETEPTSPARSRAFLIEFKNVWQTTRFVVIAPDVWQAMTAAEQEVERAFGASEYVYRPVLVKEIDALVLRAPGAVLESEATE